MRMMTTTTMNKQKIPLPPGEGGRRPGEGKKPIDPHLLKLARKLRKQQTDAEQLLWQLLRNDNFCELKFRRQYPVDPYVLDFYCHEARLGIELDGGQHNVSDKKRTDKKADIISRKQRDTDHPLLEQ